MTHPGKMFLDLGKDYNAFFDFGVGAMCWRKDTEGRRILYFLAPSLSDARFDGARIYTMTDGQDWTHPGAVKGWDGNVERPTFNPSIWLSDKEGWHGFIRDGNLIDA